MAEKTKPRVNCRFVFNYTADLAATRAFYVELLGMEPGDFNDEYGFLVVKSEGLDLCFFRAQKGCASLTEWADQPGYQAGPLEVTSYAVQVPWEDFAATVERLKAGGAPTLTAAPEWRMNSHWGFTVRDPMGNTVEVYAVPKEKPASPAWPGP